MRSSSFTVAKGLWLRKGKETIALRPHIFAGTNRKAASTDACADWVAYQYKIVLSFVDACTALFANRGFFGNSSFPGVHVATETVNVPWTVAGWIVGCLLNAGYLLWQPVRPQKSRIFGLFHLWLDTKESEFRQRLRRSQEDK
jgi:hypothetical protein